MYMCILALIVNILKLKCSKFEIIITLFVIGLLKFVPPMSTFKKLKHAGIEWQQSKY